jgi:pimeloyl-ACP methyl ester carboxylesterase
MIEFIRMGAESSAAIEVDRAKIVYRRLGNGRPLLVLNGFGATSSDWDPLFIHGLASYNELILLDNSGIGSSADDGRPFDIARLIAQTLALQHPNRVNKLILLSTDPGGSEVDLASSGVWSQLVDTSGTPHDQAKRLLSLLFPSDVAESFYRKFGDIVAAARARLSPDLINRQAAAMDEWHRSGAGDRLRGINAPVLIATGSEDVVIPSSNALKLVNAIPSAWLAQFSHGGQLSCVVPASAGRSHQLLSRN